MFLRHNHVCRNMKYTLRTLVILSALLSPSCSVQQQAPIIRSESIDTTNRKKPILTFAILKLSFNTPGDSTLEGGVCGSGFFVDPTTAVTANHVLNDSTFLPNAGYKQCRVWLITREGVIYSINRQVIKPFPAIDTTVIQLNSYKKESISSDRFDRGSVPRGAKVRGLGHVGNAMPKIDAKWEGDVLRIAKADLSSVYSDRSGHVERSLVLDVNANDVKMKTVRGFELSFSTCVGMSGGPVVNAENGQVLGMLTFGLPADAEIKTQTFAVSIDEILTRAFEDGT